MCSAARMISVPAATVTSRPSIVSVTFFAGSAAKRAPLILDVRHVLVAPQLHRRGHRRGREVAERAERPAADVAGDGDHDLQVFFAAAAFFEATQRTLDPVGAFA